MSGITVSLALCEGRAYEGRREVLFRDVNWPSVPPEGAILSYGRDEDGEKTGASCIIQRVFFGASGEVSVEAEDDNLREEFEQMVTDAKRNGFLEYAEWEAQKG